MNYLIAVLPDRMKAEEAYTALEKEGLPAEQVTIVGRGYKSADEFGFIDPNKQARKQAKFMSFWLVPFGFVAGYGFNVQTGIDVFPQLGALGSHIFGGVLGAIAAAMGSVFVGGGVALSSGSGDALPYRNRLQEGKYLVVVRGSESLKNRATGILRKFKPESLQGYSEE
ncbi:hypothetical protein IQ249_09645 [Lusitaniella coriacea LEGE 07157]|uniref:Uncharacterized protein n=1 Tax=Lusitaniella coriacea LEGE 07157 TaxID=945747 RepID=A0A8J7DW65_9CYAN|nr:hypothetical protein [Lusitaniella coriacea]MBE9116157.1 hypothetical protein [Lusitaniella coriacea LEGE 07157]